MKVLVVGGAGYIGSHMVKMLLANGHAVVTFDNLSGGHRDAVLGGEFVLGDLADSVALDKVFAEHKPQAVMHFASFIQVGESVRRPDIYYRNNISNTLNLLDAMAVSYTHLEVIERTHATNRGKGYALDFGIQHLTKNPPDVLIVLDADCVLEKDTISILVSDAMCHQRPIQALYLMQSQSHASLKIKIAEFAWLVKNWVRPLGLHRLGLPCQLMGSGMAFPWHVIKQVNLASGHIVEDMKLGVDLAKLNLAPRFCPEALVRSQFPTSEEGIKTQRTRWEHGHIGMIVKEGPFLIGQSIKHLNLKMLAIALDMCVPPLALLILIIVGLCGLGVTLSVFTQQLFPWLLPVVFLLLVGAAVMLAWLKFGRSILSFNTLMMVPFYVLAKIPLYVKFLYKRQSEWVRSKRDS